MRRTAVSCRFFSFFLLVIGLGVFAAGEALSETSESVVSTAVTAKLISAQDAVPPEAETLSVGLDLELADGWKTYWRSPGEVGTAPQIDWTGSTNVENIDMLWPAPERFTAFGIENFGYHGAVVFPLQVQLSRPGEPAVLKAKVDLLVCSTVCVPQTFDLSLSLAAGTGIDPVSASRIAEFVSRVPLEGEQAAVTSVAAYIDPARQSLTLELQSSTAFDTPDVFVELGEYVALGKPDIRLGNDGRQIWARIPILTPDREFTSAPVVTVTDGAERALTVVPKMVAGPPQPPFTLDLMAPGIAQLAWIAVTAFVGGMILNVMPCVLPVLSIKLSSTLKSHGRERRHVRRGFLAAAAGVMVFMWTLAAILYLLQQFGVAVGWGIQFQNPAFLALMFLVLAVFAANLFGLFEISIPSAWQSRLAGTGGRSGYGADFATGLFGAVLATPCSAPFLGTAIAFALAGRGVDILIVFSALGLGLALPYLLVAAVPGMIAVLPKPGRWMIGLKAFLGILLLGTALWLLWVLNGVAGPLAAVIVGILAAVLIVFLTRPVMPPVQRLAAGIVLAVLPIVSAEILAKEASVPTDVRRDLITWIAFDRSEIARRVSRGETIFLDVTADWCLTCKANKALVLERDPVLSVLVGGEVTAT